MNRQSSIRRNASLEKANRLLLAFSEATPELGVMDLARRVGLNKSTVSRFVATLNQLGLLERADDGKKYRLALRVYELGMLAVRHRPVFQHSERTLERMAEQTRETAAVAVLVDRDVVFLGKAEVNPGSPIVAGRRYPAACCAAGKILLATSTFGGGEGAVREREAGELTAAPGRSVASPRSAELARAREQGWATDHEELFAGLASVAVPVVDRRGTVAGALAIFGPAARVLAASPPASVPLLQRAAGDVSRRLGFRPGRIRLAV